MIRAATSEQRASPGGLQLVEARHRPPTPWKNGGGMQRDLLRLPGGEDWVLRASLAAITRDGPFSAFPGVTRHFAIVSGQGVQLTIGGQVHRVGAGDAALTFDGGASCVCTLVDGPVEALNLMLRGVEGNLRRVEPGLPHRSALLRGVFGCEAGELDAGARAAATRLPARTLAWFDLPATGGTTPVTLATYSAAGWWIHAEAIA